MMNVVCGIISMNQKVLICKRKTGKSMAGLWEFPGGKIESHEPPMKALKRELLEELGMRVEVNECFTTVIHPYTSFVIKLIAIKCRFVEASFVMTDHDSYKWVEVRDLLNWNLAAADIPIAKELIEEMTSI